MPTDLDAKGLLAAFRVNHHPDAEPSSVEMAALSKSIRAYLSAALPPCDGVGVKPLDDDQIMEIIREVAPWKDEPKLNDLLTYEKSPPLFPQATYDVPSYRAEKFVRAVEKRIRSALTAVPADEDAAKAGAVPVAGEAVAMGVFREGRMIGFVGLGEEFRLPEDTDERRPVYASPAAAIAAVERGALPQSPLAWVDIRLEPASSWENRVVAVNPGYVKNNGPENFIPLYTRAQILSEIASPPPSIDGETEAAKVIRNLVTRTDNFWALVQGEYGVKLSSEDRDDHNVSEFFGALNDARSWLDRLSSHPQTDEAKEG